VAQLYAANMEQPPVAGNGRKGSVPTIDNFLPGLVGVPGLGFGATVALLPSLHCFAATSWRDKSSGYIIQNIHPSPLYFRLRGASARRADATRRRIVKRILHLNLHREWFAAVGASVFDRAEVRGQRATAITDSGKFCNCYPAWES